LSLPARPLQIAVVAPIIVRYDAISLSAKDTVRALMPDPRFRVQHFGCACDFPDIAHRRCGDVSQLLLDPAYQVADAAIFHFGIHHSLFDALLAGGPRIRIVRFHNVTPARFVSAAEVPIIERSLRQIEILRRADEIWADSIPNAQELLDRGFDPTRLRIMPLVVEDPIPANLAHKPAAPIHVLYVGRIAPSKGLHDLILAVARVRLPRGAIRVTIAGNTTWSDPSYLARLQYLITRHDLADVVHFAGTVDDTERQRLFHTAHILAMPSYHEGFCRPVAEGLRAGCVPLVYDAYNLPLIAAGLGCVVPTGDIGALAAAMENLAREFPAALEYTAEPHLSLDRGRTSVAEFSDLAHRHVAGFAFETVSMQIRERLLELAQHKGASPVA
jgi:glycosyltransferase involved in cell wall biosynthesis